MMMSAAAMTAAPAMSRGVSISPRNTAPSRIGVSGMIKVTIRALVVPARCSTVKWHSDESAEPSSPMPAIAPSTCSEGSGSDQG